MDKPQKPVWGEGMFLLPHHFQQWDRYQERRLYDFFFSVAPSGWGVVHLDIEPDSLLNGRFTLLRFNGMMPDGLIVDIPDTDASPDTRLIDPFFLPAQDRLEIYLGVPRERPEGGNVWTDERSNGRPSRYTAVHIKVPDDHTGGNIQEISVARKRCKIFFQGEEIGDWVTIKIAELVRTGGGNIALREEFIPPCMMISGSPYLMRSIRGLMELLSAKIDILRDQRRGGNFPSDPVMLGALQAMGGALPQLTHFFQTGKADPEKLYLLLLRLAGELSSFSGEPLGDLRPYRHEDSSQSFKSLIQKIRVFVEGIHRPIPQVRHVVIPLERQSDHLRVGRILEDQLIAASRFYLTVETDLSRAQIEEVISKRVKGGALNELETIISTAMPGLRIAPLAQPPADVPVMAGAHCFRIESQGKLWEAVSQSRTIAFYVPADLKEFNIQLIAMKG